MLRGKFRNRWMIFGHDLLWVPVAITLAYWIRFNLGEVPLRLKDTYYVFMAIAIPAHAFSFWVFGCYRGVWRFASIPDLIRIAWAIGLGLLLTLVAMFVAIRLAEIPRSVILLYPILLATGVGGARIVYRAVRDHGLRPALDGRKRAIVVGAGRGGEMLVRDLRRNGLFCAIALVDDDPLKQGQELHGIRVRGTIDDLPRLARELSVEIALIAIPSADRGLMDRVVALCAQTEIEFRTLPSLEELSNGQTESAQLRPVTVEDLLGRDANRLDIAPDQALVDKCVVVTGGGGSIGSELCRQIASCRPRRLIVVDNSEFNLYRIEMELLTQFPGVELHASLGDVRNPVFIAHTFERHKPEVVFHAAAYKHVPILEENPCQGVENNVLGTRIVADAAVRFDAKKFVLVSTDKTVNPTSVMGATKRVAELYCQNLGRASDTTQFVTTRFGNVLGSCGSVVPLFEEQIRAGGPVTVTDPDVTRYFMTIREAVGLILQAGVIGKGGEILVMDMGQPIRIDDLARKMIRLAGKTPGRDIQVVYTGLRPGEKLHEELFYSKEDLLQTVHPKLLQASSFAVDMDWLLDGMEKLAGAVSASNPLSAIDGLRQLVPEFNLLQESAATLPEPPRLHVVR